MSKKSNPTSSNYPLILVCLLAGFLGPLFQICYEPAKGLIQERWRDLETEQQVEPIVEEAVQMMTSNETVPSAPICQNAGYIPRILMYNDPFVMHIENFISAEERAYLLELGKPLLSRSEVILENGTRMLDEQRTSSTAFLGKSDPVVECILSRAAEIQGFQDLEQMEDLQITAYAESQQYRPHYDWFAENLIPSMEYKNRISTFFVTIDADCEHCGTQFPRLSVDWSTKDPRWCQFVECDDLEKLTVKAIPGSAVFWRNLHETGWGNHKTLHAGLPVPNGKKVGVNIWSRGPVPGPV